MSHPNDQARVRAILAGEREAFDAFFERVFPGTYRLVWARSASHPRVSPAQVEAATEAVLEEVVARLSAYTGHVSLDSWVLVQVRQLLSEGEWGRRAIASGEAAGAGPHAAPVASARAR